MPVERRGAGRWSGDDQDAGGATGGRARKGSTCQRDRVPRARGRTDGLDRAAVDRPRLGGQGRPKWLRCGAGVVELENGRCDVPSILSEVTPPTGEPYAGKPPVRFGGRGA